MSTEEGLVSPNLIHKCQLCDSKFEVREDLNRHVDQCHDPFWVNKTPRAATSRNDESESKFLYHCSNCSEYLQSARELKYHLNSSSHRNILQSVIVAFQNGNRVNCSICHKTFKSVAEFSTHSLKTHKKRTRKISTPDTSAFKHACCSCFLRFKYRGDLVVHRTICHVRRGGHKHSVMTESLFSVKEGRESNKSKKNETGVSFTKLTKQQHYCRTGGACYLPLFNCSKLNGQLVYTCPFCCKTYRKYFEMKSHWQFRHGIRNTSGSHFQSGFLCCYCQFASTQRSETEKHMRTKHMTQQSKQTSTAKKSYVFPCQDCEFISNQQNNLRRHICAFHPDKKNFKIDFKAIRILKRSNDNDGKRVSGVCYQCPHCHLICKNLGALKKHVQCKHRSSRTFSVIRVGSSRKYSETEQQGKTSTSLAVQNLSSEKQEKDEALGCKQSERLLSKLNRNSKAVIRKDQIDSLSGEFDSNNLYQRTKEQSERADSSWALEGSFQCSLCRTVTSRLKSLYKHLEDKHSEPVVFYCKHCDSEFITFVELKTHLKESHSDVMVDSVRIKNVFILFNQELKQQKMQADVTKEKMSAEILSGKQTCLCNVCGNIFNWRKSLSKHVKEVHGKVLVYRCSHCEDKYRCSTFSELATHLKTFHCIQFLGDSDFIVLVTEERDKNYLRNSGHRETTEPLKIQPESKPTNSHELQGLELFKVSETCGTVKDGSLLQQRQSRKGRTDTFKRKSNENELQPSVKVLKLKRSAPSTLQQKSHGNQANGGQILLTTDISTTDVKVVSAAVETGSGFYSSFKLGKTNKTSKGNPNWDAGMRFRCETSNCGKIFLWRKSLSRHKEEYHGNTLTYICSRCPSKFKTFHLLRSHLRKHHAQLEHLSFSLHEVTILKTDTTSSPSTSSSISNSVELLLCMECGVMCADRDSYQIHKCTDLRSRYHCPYCSFVSLDLSGGRNHLASEHGHLHENSSRSEVKVAANIGSTVRSLTDSRHETAVVGENACTQMVDSHQFQCKVCQQTMTTQHLYEDHVTVCRRSPQLECPVCSKAFTSTGALRSHLHSHKDVKPYICCECEKSYPSLGTLKRHLLSHRRDSHRCQYCVKTFIERGDLERHIRTHTGVKPFQCQKCGNRYCDQRALNRHIVLKHNDQGSHPGQATGSRSDQMWVCEVCGITVASSQHLKSHIGREHQSEKLKCDHCPLVFVSQKSYKKHINQEHHSALLEQTVQGEITAFESHQYAGNLSDRRCVEIDDSMELPKEDATTLKQIYRGLRQVDKTNSSGKSFKCKLCGKNFRKTSYINLHMRRFHTKDEDKPFQCKDCGRGFPLKFELKQHERVHTNNRPYTCRICNKSFKQVGHIRDHMLIHSKNFIQRCRICDKDFKLLGSLKSHVIQHCKIQPFSCPICEDKFKDISQLIKHCARYSGDPQYRVKTYTCPLCFQMFSSILSLQKHLLGHTLDTPFSCENCPEKFSKYTDLYFHKAKHNHFTNEELQSTKYNNLTQPSSGSLFEDIQQLKSQYDVHADSSADKTRLVQEENSFHQSSQQFSEDNTTDLLSVAQRPTNLAQSDSSVSQDMRHIATLPQGVTQEHADTSTVIQTISYPREMEQRDIVDWNTQDIVINEFQEGEQGQIYSHIQDEGHIISQCEGHGIVVDQNNMTETNGAVNFGSCSAEVDTNDHVYSVTVQRFETELSDRGQSSVINSFYVGQGQGQVKGQDEVINSNTGSFQERPELIQAVIEEEYKTAAAGEHSANIVQYRSAAESDPGAVDALCLSESVGQRRTQSDSTPEATVNNVQSKELNATIHKQTYAIIGEDGSETLVCVLSEGDGEDLNNYTDVHLLQSVLQAQGNCEETTVIETQAEDIATGDSSHGDVTVLESFVAQKEIELHVQRESPQLTHNVPGQVCTESLTDTLSEVKGQPTVKGENSGASNQKLTHSSKVKQKKVVRNPTVHRNLSLVQNIQTTEGKKDEKSGTCEICQKSFTQLKLLKRHKKVHLEPSQRGFQCRVCGRGFDRPSELERHKRIHTGEKPHKCETCGRGFTQLGHLITHRRMHNNERPFQCNSCEKRFTTNSQLTKHRMVHTGEKSFPCDKCDMKFYDNSSLLRHKVTHTDKQKRTKILQSLNKIGKTSETEKRTNITDKLNITSVPDEAMEEDSSRNISRTGPQCEKCGKTFSKFSNLKRHLMRHLDTKNCKCIECGKQYSTDTLLVEHMRLHQDKVTAFPCEQCGKMFQGRRTLGRHLTNAHGSSEPQYKCVKCDRVCKSKIIFTYHIAVCCPDMLQDG